MLSETLEEVECPHISDRSLNHRIFELGEIFKDHLVPILLSKAEYDPENVPGMTDKIRELLKPFGAESGTASSTVIGRAFAVFFWQSFSGYLH